MLLYGFHELLCGIGIVGSVDYQQGSMLKDFQASRPMHPCQPGGDALLGNAQNLQSGYGSRGILQLVFSQEGEGQLIGAGPSSYLKELLFKA